MERYHPLLELAPRDVVARAITREGMDGPVYLDMRHVKKDLQARFPGISAFLAKYQLELGRDLIPVRPAAHYLMGGVKTDVHGQDLAAGAVCGGRGRVHGSAWGEPAGEQFAAGGAGVRGAGGGDDGGGGSGGRRRVSMAVPRPRLRAATPEAATERWIADLRGLMWKDAGLLRDGNGLREAQRRLDALAVTMPRGLFRRALEARNLHAVAGLIVASALGREESRGAHYRNDFPLHGAVARHSVMQRGETGVCGLVRRNGGLAGEA